MDYEKKSFTVPVGAPEYRGNYPTTFGEPKTKTYPVFPWVHLKPSGPGVESFMCPNNHPVTVTLRPGEASPVTCNTCMATMAWMPEVLRAEEKKPAGHWVNLGFGPNTGLPMYTCPNEHLLFANHGEHPHCKICNTTMED